MAEDLHRWIAADLQLHRAAKTTTLVLGIAHGNLITVERRRSHYVDRGRRRTHRNGRESGWLRSSCKAKKNQQSAVHTHHVAGGEPADPPAELCLRHCGHFVDHQPGDLVEPVSPCWARRAVVTAGRRSDRW